MPVYRDDYQALRLRATALRGEVERCEARVTAAFWRCIPEDEFETLRRTKAEGDDRSVAGDDVSLAAACDAYERYTRCFARVFGELDRYERTWRAVSDDAMPPSSVPTDVARVIAAAHPIMRAFVDAVYQIDPVAAVGATSTAREYEYVHEARASVRHGGVPLAFHLLAQGLGDEGTHVLRICATTMVPRGLPPLEARPETWTESLFRGLRRRRDRGHDPEFESFFHIECPSGEHDRVITPAVREALLKIAHVDVPTLRVTPPTATLRWRYMPTIATMLAAARCMVAVRDASVLPLLA